MKVHMPARVYNDICAVCQVALLLLLFLLLLLVLLLHDAIIAVRDCIAYAQETSKAKSGVVPEQAAEIRSCMHAPRSVWYVEPVQTCWKGSLSCMCTQGLSSASCSLPSAPTVCTRLLCTAGRMYATADGAVSDAAGVEDIRGPDQAAGRREWCS